MNWTVLDGAPPMAPLQRQLVDVGRFYAALVTSAPRPGLYVADLRLVSDVKQM